MSASFSETELQIRGVIEDNSKIIFLASCDPSLEPSQRYVFMEKYGKLSLNHPFNPSYLEHWGGGGKIFFFMVKLVTVTSLL